MITQTSFLPSVRLRPLLDRIVIRRTKAPDKIGSLFIPDQVKVKEREPTGEVIAVGRGRQRGDGSYVPLTTVVGDFVLFGRLDGQEIRVGDEEQWVVREDEVLAILKLAQEGSDDKLIVRPINDIVVIRQDETKNAGHVGSIIVPDSVKQKDGRLAAEEVATGYVVSTGSGRLAQKIRKDDRVWGAELQPVHSRVGQHVIFRAHKEEYGSFARWKDFVLVHDFDVFGTLDA
jgi:co-chaperonin GroES (HSP10)